ncbi:tetratricopeptide repeat protein [Streptomyces boninensis]|uniref:tetratricopeptide repeat protein n=1 Tax=Streptomyces boninensis TaxID=2039455 RepID=UPI003B227AD6
MTAAGGPSLQDLLRRRHRSGFVGRRAELALFRDNFGTPPEHEAHRFLFHIEGDAGIGKTSLLQQFQQIAREEKALTAQLDEAVGSVPEAMAEVSAQLARQGVELKSFDRLLKRYRERRHEAASAILPPPAESPEASPLATATAQAGLAGLGLVPGLGPVAGALDAQHVAQGMERLRTTLSARLRSHDDVQLVLAPLEVLTPAFVRDLGEAAASAPWLTLFFDTYERTGPLLDTWLRDMLFSDRYGPMPATTVVVLAGQQKLDPVIWADYADFVGRLRLELFTEDEVRGLLAAKGVTDERVVEVVLQLSGRLPVLTTMLAEGRPTDPAAIGDPSDTAVERFLKWIDDPGQREAALAAAFPTGLDEDVFRAAVAPESAGLYGWLRGLPFVADRAGRSRYHDVVRTAMLRVQRARSPQRWRESHERLAGVYTGRRQALEVDADEQRRWDNEDWAAARREETYHLLCGDPQRALPQALADAVHAIDSGVSDARRWAGLLVRAGRDAASDEVARWGERLLATLGDSAEEETAGDRREIRYCTLLLTEARLDRAARCQALCVRGREHRNAGEHEASLADFGQVLELDPEYVRAYGGRGITYGITARYEEALADMDRAVALRGDFDDLGDRGNVYRLLGRYDEALADLDRAIATGEGGAWEYGTRGEIHRMLDHHAAALADLDIAVELDPENAFARAARAQTYTSLGRYDVAVAEFTRVIELAPELAWNFEKRAETRQLAGEHEAAVADFTAALELDPTRHWSLGQRGESLGQLGRDDEALADLTAAIELEPEYRWAYTERAAIRHRQGRSEEALADLTRALEGSAYAYARVVRGVMLRDLGRSEEALADLDEAVRADPAYAHAFRERGVTHKAAGRYDDALADFDRVLELQPGNAWAAMHRVQVLAESGRTGAAHAGLDALLAAEPEHAGAHQERGRLYLLERRYEEAAQQLERALEFDPDDSRPYLLLAGCALLTGAHELAGAHLASLAAAESDEGEALEALLSTVVDGVAATADRWTALLDTATDAWDLLLCHCGRGDWPAAERALAELLDSGPDWSDLVGEALLLDVLAGAPGADAPRLLAYRDRLQEAGDALAVAGTSLTEAPGPARSASHTVQSQEGTDAIRTE